jgi:nucleoid-associated protein YgaU
VEKLSQKFVMFRSDGVPVRARLNVTFRGHKALSEQLRDPRRNSADKTKRRVLSSDTSIWLIANHEYGDPRGWRLIARENRIDDPRAIRPGAVLVVPPLDEKKGSAAP